MPGKKGGVKKGGKDEDLDAIISSMQKLDKKKSEKEKEKPQSSVGTAPEANIAPDPYTLIPKTVVDEKIKKSLAANTKTFFPNCEEDPEFKLAQTEPEPTIPLRILYPKKSYPVGKIWQYKNMPEEEAKLRFTSPEYKRKDKLITPDSMIADLRKAAEAHKQARKWLRTWVKPGMTMMEICDRTENKVRELLEGDGVVAGLAFPMGCSLNHVAAHYTPNAGDFTVLGQDDVVKFDIGTHVNGHIVDSAFTMCWNPQYQELLDITHEATMTGVREAGVDARLGEVGAKIQEVMESGEVTINGKTFNVRCVRNLSGHTLGDFTVHAGKMLPIVGNEDDPSKMEEGDLFACETFGSTGKGYVRDEGECSHFMLSKQANMMTEGLKSPGAKQLHKTIEHNFKTLAWSRRSLDRLGLKGYQLNLSQLARAGVVDEYPPLADIHGCFVAQFEHTFLLKPSGKEVFSIDDDY